MNEVGETAGGRDEYPFEFESVIDTVKTSHGCKREKRVD